MPYIVSLYSRMLMPTLYFFKRWLDPPSNKIRIGSDLRNWMPDQVHLPIGEGLDVVVEVADG
jgi:hypothetical protein